jgi:phage shock protein PspC (stress-responsive transcriptional regulator)
MGPKGIFLAFIIVCSIYLWRKYRKKEPTKLSRWVNWVLGGIAVYYGISAVIMFLDKG